MNSRNIGSMGHNVIIFPKTDKDDFQDKSKEARKNLTGQWRRQGVDQRWQYGDLTRKQYEGLFDDPSLKKQNMNEEQKYTLLICDCLEALKLSGIEENFLGYHGCVKSISETAASTRRCIEEVKNNRPISPHIVKVAG